MSGVVIRSIRVVRLLADNDLHGVVIDYVCQHRGMDLFNTYFKMYSSAPPDYRNNHLLWVDYLLDRYNIYKSAGNSSFESEVFCILDGIEAVMARSDGNELEKKTEGNC